MISVIGTVALDTIKTPFGHKQRLLGGSAVFSSIAASIFSTSYLHAVIGDDFPDDYLLLLREKKIELSNLEIAKQQKTFHWEGYYEEDMAQAHTQKTELNVLSTFLPNVCEKSAQNKIVLCANLDPDIQQYVIKKFNDPQLIVLDTMNFWITNKRDSLLKAIQLCDVLIINDMELKLLTGASHLLEGLKSAIQLGPSCVIVKKGEHGAMMYNGQEFFSVPANIVERVVDPTGAGDSFAGAFCGYLGQNVGPIRYEDLKKAMVMGILVSSLTVQAFSVEALMPLTQEKVSYLLSDYKGLTSVPD